VPHKHCTVRNAKLYKFEFNMRSGINCYLLLAYEGGRGLGLEAVLRIRDQVLFWPLDPRNSLLRIRIRDLVNPESGPEKERKCTVLYGTIRRKTFVWPAGLVPYSEEVSLPDLTNIIRHGNLISPACLRIWIHSNRFRPRFDSGSEDCSKAKCRVCECALKRRGCANLWNSAQIGSYSIHLDLSSANWCGSGSGSGSSLSLWCGSWFFFLCGSRLPKWCESGFGCGSGSTTQGKPYLLVSRSVD